MIGVIAKGSQPRVTQPHPQPSLSPTYPKTTIEVVSDNDEDEDESKEQKKQLPSITHVDIPDSPNVTIEQETILTPPVFNRISSNLVQEPTTSPPTNHTPVYPSQEPSLPSNNPGFFASISSFSSRHPIFTFGLADAVASGVAIGGITAVSYGMAGNSSYLTAHIGAGIASWQIPLMVGAAAFGLFLLYNWVKACSNAPSSDSQTPPESQYGTLDDPQESNASAPS